MRKAFLMPLLLLAVAATAQAGTRYPNTPVPGSVQPVVLDVFDQNDGGATTHPNCRYGAPCCCVANSTDPGFCTGTSACTNSSGTCTSDSSKCRNG